MPSRMESPQPSRSLTPEQEEEILALARPETLIQAIKRYREFTHASLAEAQAAVEAMMAAPPKLEAAAPPLPTRPAEPGGMTPALEAELADMLRQGAKIPAIKRYREAIAGTDLREAKEAVEALAKKHGIPAKSGPCFVATAVFEDEAAPEVVILRRWRDERLARRRGGRVLIGIYGWVGPRAAALPRHSPALRACLRGLFRRCATWLDPKQSQE